MPVLLGNYDPAQQNIVFGGVVIDGFAEGSFIKVSRNQDTWQYKPSNSGGGGRARNPDRSGRFEFTLHAQAPANAYLSTISRTDELTGAGVGECQVRDRTTLTAACTAAQAWVVKPADFERAKEIGEITWVIESPDVTIVHDGSIPLT